MTLPDAENQIEAILVDQNLNIPWKEGINVVMNAENDSQIATRALDNLRKSTRPRLVIRIPARKPPQVEEAETELMTAVHSLKDRNRIHGPVLSVDEIVESPDEVDPEVEELPIDDDSIVDAVRKEMVAGKEIVEIDALIRSEQIRSAKQTTLDTFFRPL